MAAVRLPINSDADATGLPITSDTQKPMGLITNSPKHFCTKGFFLSLPPALPRRCPARCQIWAPATLLSPLRAVAEGPARLWGHHGGARRRFFP